MMETTNERKRTAMTAFAVLAMLLLTPVASAQGPGADGGAGDGDATDADDAGASDAGAAGSSDGTGADDRALDVRLDAIEVVRDDANGTIDLRVGASEVGISYGGGEIGMLSTQTRHLGIADVFDERRGYHDRVGIPAEAIVWQRLTHVGEYVDVNGNGLFDVRSPGLAGPIDEMDEMHTSHEPVIKWIEFDDIDWTLARWTESRSSDAFELTFALVAEDLDYEDDDGPISGVALERMVYEFRVTATREQVTIDAVPHYRVLADDVDRDDPRILDSIEDEAFRVNATVLDATWKYDQIIEGWDVAMDANGSERNDTRLAVLSEFAFGVHLDTTVARWMHEQFGRLASPRAVAGDGPPVRSMVRDAAPAVDHDAHGRPLDCGLAYVTSDGMPGSPHHTEARQTSGDDGSDQANDGQDSDQAHDGQGSDHDGPRSDRVRDRMHEYRDTACVQRGADVETDFDAPRAIRSGGLHFDGNGQRIGQIRWVSNATVDGVETEVLFQLHGARPVLPSDVDGADGLWAGMRMVGAYNYVIGENQTHDPEFTTDVVVFEAQSYGEPIVWEQANAIQRLLSSGAVRAILVVMLGVVVVFVAASLRQRRPPMAPMPPTSGYTLGVGGDESEWARYRT